jgi:hypothetical protein
MVTAIDAKPIYKTAAPFAVPFIVPPAPITRRNNETAAKIGYLLESGT